MILLLEVVLPFLGTILNQLSHSGAPSEVIQAVENAIASLQSHKNDLVTKTNLEAQRG